MPKYLVQGSYKPEGVKGLIKDGGSTREAQVGTAIRALGGSVESFYFALGSSDVFVVVDLPDHVRATAISLAVNATGAVEISTTVLLTAEEMDQAAKLSVNYNPPGR